MRLLWGALGTLGVDFFISSGLGFNKKNNLYRFSIPIAWKLRNNSSSPTRLLFFNKHLPLPLRLQRISIAGAGLQWISPARATSHPSSHKTSKASQYLVLPLLCFLVQKQKKREDKEASQNHCHYRLGKFSIFFNINTLCFFFLTWSKLLFFLN